MGLTEIGWADYTFNTHWGCTKISAGCANCYAERLAASSGSWWGDGAERRFLSDGYWNNPLAWNRKAKREGTRFSVFTGSMCDVFEQRDDLIQVRKRLGDLIRATPHLDWLMLTKRPMDWVWAFTDMEFVQEELDSDAAHEWYVPDNVWIGVTAENQETYNMRVPLLICMPVKHRFLSMEPLLEHVEIDQVSMIAQMETYDQGSQMLTWPEHIDWIIAGGESGPNARPMKAGWVRDIRDRCVEYSIPFFFKQWGGVYKRSAGRILDGRTWEQIPFKPYQESFFDKLTEEK